MSAIAWWAVPIVATIAAIVYVTWRGRPRPPEDTHEAMEAREQFRRAIETGVPTHGRRSRAGRTPRERGDQSDGTQPGV